MKKQIFQFRSNIHIYNSEPEWKKKLNLSIQKYNSDSSFRTMLKLWVREGKEIFIFRNIIHMWASKAKLLLVNLFLLFINIVQIHYFQKEKEAYELKSLNMIIQMKINFLDYIVDRNQNLLFSSCCFLVRMIAKEPLVLSFLWHMGIPQ